MLLANNHLNDYGDKPVNLTVNILKKLGIQSFGINYGPYDAPQVSDVITHKPICVKRQIEMVYLLILNTAASKKYPHISHFLGTVDCREERDKARIPWLL